MRAVTRRRARRPVRAIAACAAASALLAAWPAAAQAPPGDPEAAFPAPAAGTEGVREALSRAIARLEADVAGLARLARWQADLARIARTDRAEALRQRRPMADCLASALAPACDRLEGLFRPGEETAAAAREGEGAR